MSHHPTLISANAPGKRRRCSGMGRSNSGFDTAERQACGSYNLMPQDTDSVRDPEVPVLTGEIVRAAAHLMSPLHAAAVLATSATGCGPGFP